MGAIFWLWCIKVAVTDCHSQPLATFWALLCGGVSAFKAVCFELMCQTLVVASTDNTSSGDIRGKVLMMLRFHSVFK